MKLFKRLFFRELHKKPDFIIAGFSKCGTTALAHNLGKHPDIHIARLNDSKNELQFFNNEKRWEKGCDWYFNHFHGVCAGEKTPSYVYTKVCMERIARIVPDVKLILCVRNPVDRLVSWYNHKIIRMKKSTLEEPPFSSYHSFYKGHMYDPLSTGCYADVITRNVLPFFPLERCFFIIQEQMAQNPEHEIQPVLRYLGLSEYPIECGYHNVSRDKINIDPNTRNELLEYYYKHNEEFTRLTGIPVAHWNQ